MCFTIDENAKSWKQAYAWKILYYDPFTEYLYSPFKGNRWRKGSYFIAQRTSTCRKTYEGVLKAEKGVYVFKTKNLARQYGITSDEVILKVKVDPEDFLFTDGKGQATYKKVYLPEDGEKV
jgi:hypothetical protein